MSTPLTSSAISDELPTPTQQSNLTSEISISTVPPPKHPTYFFDDGNFCILAGDMLFNVHRSLLMSRIEPVRDMMELPSPAGSKPEGSLEQPVHFPVNSKAFESFLALVYDSDKLLTGQEVSFEMARDILQLSSMWMYDQGVQFAIQKIDSAELDPYLKLLYGIHHAQKEWVTAAVKKLFNNGYRLSKPDWSTASTEVVFTSTMKDNVVWILHLGSQLMADTITELIHSPPRMENSDDADWSSSKCDQHAQCITSVKRQWPSITRSLSVAMKQGGGSAFALNYDLPRSIRTFKFGGMDPRCRDRFMLEIGHRCFKFWSRICVATSDRLLEK